MLKSLSISNYALIQKLHMHPHAMLNTITGETGAGKSIMLGAVGLLLGNRADTKALLEPESKCLVEGIFEISAYGLERFFEQEDLDFEKETIIRREISPTGKSRAFINDTPVKLETLKELGKSLMDVHSQHDNLQLGDGGYQLHLIDAYAETYLEKANYSDAYKAYANAKKQLDQKQREAIELKKEADFNRFQLDELAILQLKEDEQESLEEQQEILDNAEAIKAKIQEILQQIQDENYGAARILSSANQALQQLVRLSQKFSTYGERFQSLLIELNDIASSLEEEDDRIEVDSEKLEKVRDRLSKIYTLQQKHGMETVAELMQLEQELTDKVFLVDNLDDQLEELKMQKDAAEKKMLETGKILQEKRKGAFLGFANELSGLLHQLGMENARVAFSHQEVAPTKNGLDWIDLLFSANKGIEPQALKQVASGGEFSRLIFAIKYIMADKMAMPTLLFDEIDTGVSGEIALQMVRMMQDIAQKHQVICISHLPQVAAKGDQHYFVYKDNSAEKTVSKIRLLQSEERVSEIAKMIAGANPSASAYESAKELLTR